jgi:ABC-type amino acid transport substrate-binding protein
MRLVILSVLALCFGSAVAAQDAGGRLQTIKDSGVLKVAYRADSRPFSYLGADKKPAGYTIDLCLAIARDLEQSAGTGKLEVRWIEVDAATRFDVMARGEADLECGSTTVSLSRMARVDFSNLIFVDSTGVLMWSGKKENNFRDLGGRKVGLVAGSTNARAARAYAERHQVAVTLIDFRDRDLGFAALMRGEVDGFATDKLVLRAFQETQGRADFQLLPDDLSAEPFAIMLPQGDWRLRNAVNAALARIFRSGEVVQLYTKYFARFGSQPSSWLGALFTFGALPD